MWSSSDWTEEKFKSSVPRSAPLKMHSLCEVNELMRGQHHQITASRLPTVSLRPSLSHWHVWNHIAHFITVTDFSAFSSVMPVFITLKLCLLTHCCRGVGDGDHPILAIPAKFSLTCLYQKRKVRQRRASNFGAFDSSQKTLTTLSPGLFFGGGGKC